MARLPGDGSVERDDAGASAAPRAAGGVNAAVNHVREREPEARASSAERHADPGHRRGVRHHRPSHGVDPSITDLAWTLLERRWTIVPVAAAVLACAAAFLFVATPVYESSVLIQVEGRSRPVTAFEDLAALFQEQTPTEGEMRIMKSRTLLEGVVDHLNLDVVARPRTFPVFGAALARRYGGTGPAPARFGLERFAWGGERIVLDTLEVSDALLGKALVLTALEGGHYRLEAPDREGNLRLLAEGEVGHPITGADGARRVELLVAELQARPGTEFELVRRARLDVVEGLQGALRIAEQGRLTGLVEVTLANTDPARLAAILDAVSSAYRRFSVERTSAEAAKTLAVLEAQLPVLKRNLERAEGALHQFHRRNGTVNLSFGAEDLVRQLGEVDRSIAQAEVERAELSARFNDRVPDLVAVDQRTSRLKAQRTALESRVQELPRLELESARLARQLRVATDLYMLVLNRAEELRIVKSGWIGNARVLEQAVAPRRPISPNPPLILVLGMLLGLGAGVAVALARNAFDQTVRDPDEIEGALGLSVMATIPRSRAQRKLGRRGRLSTLAVTHPGDAAVEELRALRTSVQFALRRSRNNVIAIGGLAPGAGKSVVSVNLAHLLAAADGKVLLVDGDLRRGVLHRYVGAGPQPGVVEVVTGKATLEEALRPTDTPNLDLLAAGQVPANAADLLAGAPFEALVSELGRRYKVVIIDTPPILAVTDSALIGRHAGLNLLVLRAGRHSLGEISSALRRLAQTGVVIKGAILNDVRPVWGKYRVPGRYGPYELVRGERELH